MPLNIDNKKILKKQKKRSECFKSLVLMFVLMFVLILILIAVNVMKFNFAMTVWQILKLKRCFSNLD